MDKLPRKEILFWQCHFFKIGFFSTIGCVYLCEHTHVCMSVVFLFLNAFFFSWILV